MIETIIRFIIQIISPIQANQVQKKKKKKTFTKPYAFIYVASNLGLCEARNYSGVLPPGHGSRLEKYEPRHEKMCLREFPTRSDSNWPAQLQKLESWNFGYII